jgi:hypothetical protein
MHSKERYIITAIHYLTHWVEVEVVQGFSVDTVARFIFWNIITNFGCPQSMTNDQGAHFISETIAILTRDFFI